MPGLKHARDLAAPAGAKRAAAWACGYKYFCMYRGQDGTGSQLNLFNCTDYALSNWVGFGSWYNNQSPGTEAQFKGQEGGGIVIALGTPSYLPSYNWYPIWFVKPC